VNKNYRWLRIATSDAGLAKGHFFIRGLPEPILITFAQYSVKTEQGQGGKARHGYKRASVLWDYLTATQAAALTSVITAAETTYGVGNGIVYLTIPDADGSIAGVGMIDVYGVADLPQFNSPQGASGLLYENVLLTLNNVTIVHKPALYT